MYTILQTTYSISSDKHWHSRKTKKSEGPKHSRQGCQNTKMYLEYALLKDAPLSAVKYINGPPSRDPLLIRITTRLTRARGEAAFLWLNLYYALLLRHLLLLLLLHCCTLGNRARQRLRLLLNTAAVYFIRVLLLNQST